ncbi:hypothetical protein Tco_0052189 [Tanacetum coccineum]
MVNSEKNQRTFDDVMGSVIDFTNFTKNCLKKDKITKADLEGPAFKLMKGIHKNYIELEYNFKQCYLALKPLPLHDAPGRLTIPVDFFFNKDLEYLTTGNVEKKYATSLTKPKSARYHLEGIKEMIPQLWSSTKFGYGYLKEIVVRRANQKEYTFKEEDFPQIHLNDIKDMYLLYAQNKLRRFTCNDQTDLVRCVGLDNKEPYTIFHKPREAVYPNKDDKKYLMRKDELYKFGDDTLKKVCDELNYRLQNFVLGYNEDMPKRTWPEKDQRQTKSMLKEIEKTLLKIRIIRSLECFVSGRKIEMDYRLLTRTK